MDTTGRMSFELEGVNYSLFFSMIAIEIYQTKSFNEVKRLKDAGLPLEVDDIKAMSYIIYAGLCGYADLKEKVRPSFEQAYELADSLCYLDNSELVNEIFECFNNSRASKALRQRLGIEKKSDPESLSKQTGKE